MNRKEISQTIPQTIDRLTRPILLIEHYKKQALAFRQTFPQYVTDERVKRLEKSYLLHPLSFCRLLRETEKTKTWPGIILRSFTGAFAHDKYSGKIYDNLPTILFNLGWLDLVVINHFIQIGYPDLVGATTLATSNMFMLVEFNANKYHEVCHALSFQDPKIPQSGIVYGVDLKKTGKKGENEVFNEILTCKFTERAMRNDGLTPWISCFSQKLLLFPRARWIWNHRIETVLSRSYGKEEKETLLGEAYWNGKLDELVSAFNQAPHRGKETFEELSRRAGRSLG